MQHRMNKIKAIISSFWEVVFSVLMMGVKVLVYEEKKVSLCIFWVKLLLKKQG